MGRRSLVSERRPHIIASAKSAVAKYGLAGATQQRISEEAGLSRSHIRHYVGNRDDVLDEVWESTIGPYLDHLRRAVAEASDDAVLDNVLDYLFGPLLARNEDDAVIEAFLTVAVHDRELGLRMHKSYSAIEEEITHAIRRVTGADHERAGALAYALICMTAGNSTMSTLPFPKSRTQHMPQIAKRMIQAVIEGEGT